MSARGEGECEMEDGKRENECACEGERARECDSERVGECEWEGETIAEITSRRTFKFYVITLYRPWQSAALIDTIRRHRILPGPGRYRRTGVGGGVRECSAGSVCACAGLCVDERA